MKVKTRMKIITILNLLSDKNTGWYLNLCSLLPRCSFENVSSRADIAIVEGAYRTQSGSEKRENG